MPGIWTSSNGNVWLPVGTNATTSTPSTHLWVNCTSTATTTSTWINGSWPSGAEMARRTIMGSRIIHRTVWAPRWEEDTPRRPRRTMEEHQSIIVNNHEDAAKERARELLLAHLTERQRETFIQNGWFVVEGGKSGRQYRIHAQDHLIANVEALDREGKATHRLCAHPPLHAVPLGDHLLAQKVMLELAEDDFLRKANRHAA